MARGGTSTIFIYLFFHPSFLSVSGRYTLGYISVKIHACISAFESAFSDFLFYLGGLLMVSSWHILGGGVVGGLYNCFPLLSHFYESL